MSYSLSQAEAAAMEPPCNCEDPECPECRRRKWREGQDDRDNRAIDALRDDIISMEAEEAAKH